MTELELRKYYTVITDAWKLFKDHSTPSGHDDFWGGLIRATDALHQKHEQTIFSEKILNATLNEIQEVYKRNLRGLNSYPAQEIQTSIFGIERVIK